MNCVRALIKTNFGIGDICDIFIQTKRIFRRVAVLVTHILDIWISVRIGHVINMARVDKHPTKPNTNLSKQMTFSSKHSHRYMWRRGWITVLHQPHVTIGPQKRTRHSTISRLRWDLLRFGYRCMSIGRGRNKRQFKGRLQRERKCKRPRKKDKKRERDRAIKCEQMRVNNMRQCYYLAIFMFDQRIMKIAQKSTPQAKQWLLFKYPLLAHIERHSL